MAQYRVNFFGVVRVVLRNHGMGRYELHIDAFRREEALVFGHVPRQAENRSVGLARHLLQIMPPILIISVGSPIDFTMVYDWGRMTLQTWCKGKFLDSNRCLT